MFKSLDEQRREAGGGRELRWQRVPFPLKCFIAFAVVSYGIQMYVTYAPLSTFSRLSSLARFVLAYSVCPVCILTPTVDPSPSDMAYFIGPINAVIRGALGAMVGYLIEIFA